MKTNINQNDKRIITNEQLYDLMVSSIADLRKSTLDGFDRVFEVMDENTKEIKSEFKKDLSDLRIELKTDINDLRVELKTDISDFRKEMNQRFLTVDSRFIIIDGRLCNIEDNMVYKHQVFPKFT
jgi:hypothetical protein